jgi:UDP-N-acetylmuramoylalanine--D-glutamate ligase
MPLNDLNLQAKRVAVIGAMRSGIAAAAALKSLGASVLLTDTRPETAFSEAVRVDIEASCDSYRFHSTPEQAVPDGTDLVVTSPGVPRNAAPLQRALQLGIPIWSEIELAYRIAPCKIVAVTGTNGKTTTAVLTAHILNHCGIDAVVAGNVSADGLKCVLTEAALEACNAGAAERVIVAEISSFQLEWVHQFRPFVGMLTNVTPDHLNRHSTFEEYVEAKENLFRAQVGTDYALYGADNEASLAASTHGFASAAILVSSGALNHAPNASVINGWLTYTNSSGEQIPLLPVQDMPETLPGAHNVANTLMAAATSLLCGADPGMIGPAICTFSGVPHRMEFVAEINGIRYINNSMCTNIAAAIASIQAVRTRQVVIAGGADKELDFSPLGPVLEAHADYTVLIGAAADKMEAAFRASGYNRIVRESTLEAAVAKAARLAEPGSTVLLAPACASFDMFSDFEHRGAAFRSAVHSLRDGGK